MSDLIPREVFFKNPEKTAPQISPDGKKLAYLAPSKEGVLNIWIRTLGKADDRQVTTDTGNGIGIYTWAADSRRLLFFQDRQGDEVQHLFSVDPATHAIRDLTPFIGVRAQNLLVGSKAANQVLVGMNLRNRRVFDMYRVDLDSGAIKLDTENPGDVLSWCVDSEFNIRACSAILKDASTEIRIRDSVKAPWRTLLSVPFKDSLQLAQQNGGNAVVGFSKDGRSLYAVTAKFSEMSRLVALDTKTGKVRSVVAADPRCDVDDATSPDGTVQYAVVVDPDSGKPQAVGFDYQKIEWRAIDPSVTKDIARLNKLGTYYFVNADKANRKWIVQVVDDAGPQKVYLYDRKTGKATMFFEDRPDLEKYRLVRMQPVTIVSRDGLSMVGYLMLPEGKGPHPMVLNPHGGPWYRDRWGFSPENQLLANRGYAVLNVNFRGSTGYGKRFLNASNGEWARKMLDDLEDAVKWAVANGYADPKRVGIMGGSYGGYATLCGAAFKPEVFACAVEEVGPSDVAALLKTIPAYWGPIKTRWVRRIGNAEKDSELNRRISPLFHADQIRAPLLIGHGANDPRVNLSASVRIAEAMRTRNRLVKLIVYPDEGHGWSRPENNLDWYGRVEEFLAEHLGGKRIPWSQVKGSTAEEK